MTSMRSTVLALSGFVAVGFCNLVFAQDSVRSAPAPGMMPSVTAPPAPTSSPASNSPAPRALEPQIQRPGSAGVQAAGPLLGIWEGARDLEDPRVREITRVEFRADGVVVATTTLDSPVAQNRKPVVAKHRYVVRGVAGGVYAVEFEYIGDDREVEAEDRRRLVQFSIGRDGTLRTDDGATLARIK